MSTLQDAIRKLADARTAESLRKAELAIQQVHFEQTHDDLIAAKKAASAAVQALDAEVRALAQLEHEQTHDKTLWAGVKVQDAPEYAVNDGDAALAFCKASGVAYRPETYDEKELLTMAKAMKTPPAFITVTPGYKVTIPTDLAKAIADATPTETMTHE